MPGRRHVLATIGSLLATGCLDATAGDSTTGDAPDDRSGTQSPTATATDTTATTRDGPDTTPPTRTYTTIDGEASADCTSGFYVSVESFSPARSLPIMLTSAEQSLVASLAADGPRTLSLYAYDPPIRDGVYVEHEAAYYRVSTTRRGRETVPARLFDVTWERGRTPSGDATVVAFETLPAADRGALRLIVEGPRFDDEEDHPTEGFSATDYPAPYPDGTGDSRLVGNGTTWVRWNDRAYRVSVGKSATATRHTFELDVSQVATDATGFRDQVADEFLVVLSDLSPRQGALLRTAVGESYEECAPASEALSELRTRLSESETLPSPHGQSWYVAFHGHRYRLEITEWIE